MPRCSLWRPWPKAPTRSGSLPTGECGPKLATSGSVIVQGLPTATTTLRKTLGLSAVAETLSGAGIGVAIIDSGIAPLTDFGGRITDFYDFTTGGTFRSRRMTSRPRHARRRADRRQTALSDARIRASRRGARLIGLKVLDGTGPGRRAM